MPRVTFVCQLRHWSRLEGIEVEAVSVREALLQLVRVPGFPAGFIDGEGNLHPAWCVVVDGEQIDSASVSTRTLRPDSEVMPVPRPQWIDRDELFRREVERARRSARRGNTN